ncbi:MAG: hypothetical protein Fur0023_17600 [Bacteroidia bacterium]
MNAKGALIGNKLIIIFLMGMSIHYAHAQKWNIYVNTGYSQCTQAYNNIADINPWKKNIHNMFFGIKTYFSLSNKWKISLSAYMIEKGYKNEYTMIFDDIDSTNQLVRHIEIKDKIKYSLNYIEFPLTLHYSAQKWLIGGGLFFSYKLAFSRYLQMNHQSYQYQGTNNQYQIICSNSLELGSIRGKEGYPLNLLGTDFDIGFNIDLAYKITNRFFINFYYSYGYNNSFNYQNSFYTSLGHQTSFLLGISYKILEF